MREPVDPRREDLRAEQDPAEREERLRDDEPARRPVRIESRADAPQVRGEAERVECLELLGRFLDVARRCAGGF